MSTLDWVGVIVALSYVAVVSLVKLIDWHAYRKPPSVDIFHLLLATGFFVIAVEDSVWWCVVPAFVYIHYLAGWWVKKKKPGR